MPQDGEDQMFGPPPENSVYWDQPTPGTAPAQPGEGVPAGRETKIGDKATLTLEQDAEATIMNLPGIAPALLAHGKKLAEHANANAQTPGAQYEAVLVKDQNGRAQVMVQSANREAELDEASYSTLTVAMTTGISQASSEEQ